MPDKPKTPVLEDTLGRLETGVGRILQMQEKTDGRLDSIEEKQKAFEAEMVKIRAEHGDAMKTVNTRIETVERAAPRRTLEIPGLDEEVKKNKFNLARCLIAAATRDWSEAGFEKEVCDATKKRALAAGTSSTGGVLVPMQAIPEVIELIRAKSIARMLGIRVLPGLMGSPVPMPKVTGGATAYAVGENKDITASEETFGEAEMHPHCIAALVKLSRRLVNMSNPAAEAIVRDDVAKVLALFEDKLVFKGSGASGEPLGVANQSGILTSTLATIGTNAYDKLVDFVGKLETANTLTGNLGWAFHPTGKQLLQKQKDADGRPLFFDANPSAGAALRQGPLLGFGWETSTQLAATDAFFANWDDVVLGEWGVLEIDASTETSDAFQKHQLWIKILKEIDVMVRHPESIVYVSDLAA